MSASLFFAVKMIKYVEERAAHALTFRQTCGPLNAGMTQSRIASRGAFGS
jgi:hypothetical protein